MLEVLSDTGLGKEMHSVVSQGRVEAIVTSKPRDRRMLIEEAAGLGKHRKRRRRAQLKLERTQDNLDRALDVEREARTRLRPLKRQAEAAELHERLERQTLEARWELAREGARARREPRWRGRGRSGRGARARPRATEPELARGGRRGARRPSRRWPRAATEREGLSSRFYAARSARERIGLREEARAQAAASLRRSRRRGAARCCRRSRPRRRATARRRRRRERIAALEAELEQLGGGPRERLERELAELEAARAEAAEQRRGAGRGRRCGWRGAARPTPRAEAARRARREAEAAAERARREAARVGAELREVNQFLRAHAGAPRRRRGAGRRAERRARATSSRSPPCSGPRLRAAVAADLGEGARAARARGARRRRRAGRARDGARRRRRRAAGARRRAAGRPRARRRRRPRSPTALLSDVWVVDSLDGLAADFAGIAVTRDGRVWSAATRELRQVPAGGEDRVLAERNRREALIAEVERAAQAEQAALARSRRPRAGRRPPTPAATGPSARRAQRRAPATRPPRPSGTPAG